MRSQRLMTMPTYPAKTKLTSVRALLTTELLSYTDFVLPVMITMNIVKKHTIVRKVRWFQVSQSDSTVYQQLTSA